MWQAEHVAARLIAEHSELEVELLPMSTRGDKILDAPLAKIGGKGLFLKELEQALLDGRADIAVHSMKDVPVELPEGLCLPVIMARTEPFDALVSNRWKDLDELPEGAVVGTSSLRRQAQLRSMRADLKIADLRGNVNTRLGKLDGGEYDAIILAVAGLKRLAFEDRIASVLAPPHWLPAAAQGALGIECRSDDASVDSLIAPLRCPKSTATVEMERAFNRRLGGSCQVPIGAYATLQGDELALSGLVARPDGSRVVRSMTRASHESAHSAASALAEELLEAGADEILAALQ